MIKIYMVVKQIRPASAKHYHYNKDSNPPLVNFFFHQISENLIMMPCNQDEKLTYTMKYFGGFGSAKMVLPMLE